MSKRFFAVFASVMIFTSAPAMACTSLQEALGQFEEVKNAYIAKAPNMTPQQFSEWKGHLEKFGAAMQTADFAGACSALQTASVELGFGVAAAAEAPVPAPQPETSTQGQATEAATPAIQPSGSTSGSLTSSGSGLSGGLLSSSGASGEGSAQSGGGLTSGGPTPAQQTEEQPPAIVEASEPAWVECPRGRCWLRR